MRNEATGTVVASVILLVIFKLVGWISWSWWLVTGPLWWIPGSVVIFVGYLLYRRAKGALLERWRIKKMVRSGVDLRRARSAASIMRVLGK